METPWQLGWVCGRLVPRWIVEHLAGRRAQRVRLAFVDTTPEESERVALRIAGRLGAGWRLEIEALHAIARAPRARVEHDLVWALDARAPVTAGDRFPRLASSLAPGGCLVVSPTETDAGRAGLHGCSSPGLFFRSEPSAPAEGILADHEIRELERENVLRALERAEWRVSGPRGAAALLGLRPSTLRDRMRAFGIVRES